MRSLLSRLGRKPVLKTPVLIMLLAVFAGLMLWRPLQAQPVEGSRITASTGTATSLETSETFRPFSLFTDPNYSQAERVSLLVVLGIAFAGLAYAAMLMTQVNAADKGTPKMQAVASAVREGANAYMSAQFKKIAIFIVLLTIVLLFTYSGEGGWSSPFAIGRAVAFLAGSIFSWLVGFVGMRLATSGNLRVAAAAKSSYGEAMQLGYRTGTVTGMLTDGLGLLGGTIIFLIFSDKAYEALLGFGFGSTLLALFMRVGGGIYTKAADVGADLVGKIEKDIPEDDPRNAATIADNVGDNVGDCAGMAADIFQSYEVTIVAAMILGLASYGHKGVVFPLLVRGIGVLGSIISTYTVRAGKDDNGDTALKSVHRGFWIGSIISVIGFFGLAYFYMRFSGNLLAHETADVIKTYPYTDTSLFPKWVNFGVAGLDMRPAIACLVGVILAIALNKVTSYFTHTSYPPTKSLAKACTTGHATNIIAGLAVGYESSVAAILVIGGAIWLSVMAYAHTPPLFVAYGVAMAGIGMLTLTGNTISMDVFGPVADNANGIGEMGYDAEEMDREKPGSYKKARQILADLDAVGNTTKAETKGIAIGSAVIAAVSLFGSFIAILAVGSEDKIASMHMSEYFNIAKNLNVAEPMVFIGFLIGGATPMLFSSMLMRAVGRAAFLIVKECRVQFRDREIWAGTKKPDYGRVVDICTIAAQKELIGPGFLAIFTPLLIGFVFGPYALGGFLAGMILVGQLLAVFMCNAGGAWDNAKKMIEDGIYGGKGSEAHKAAVTGDTVGDPLKDTAGPAINPLIKVMNMVGLLALGLVLKWNLVGIGREKLNGSQDVATWDNGAKIGLVVAALCFIAIWWAVWQSRRENDDSHVMEEEVAANAAPVAGK